MNDVVPVDPTGQVFDPAVVAREVSEGVTNVKNFFAMTSDQKVLVVRHLLDAQIGTDEGASLSTLPGMTPELTEMITDPLLDMLAKVVVDQFFS